MRLIANSRSKNMELNGNTIEDEIKSEAAEQLVANSLETWASFEDLEEIM